MSVLSGLYRLLIGPLELFFEVIYCLADHVLANPGLSIVALSLAMNFLVLPLYRRADAMQAEQRETELRMKPWVDEIRRTFSGEERFMMLQTYYRQVGYKQTDALKGSVSLLLEVPFFIAAYRFLSGLEVLQGVPFGPIRDLGAPDGLLAAAGLRLNALPILMTAVNLVSAAIYLKGFPLKSKLQMTGMALVFLVLLYDSPAGLVLYWTLNNVFSLVKNIFYKLKRPGLVLRVLAALCGGAGLVFVLLVRPLSSARRQILAILLLLGLTAPLALQLFGRRAPVRLKLPGEDRRLFLYGGLFLTALTGLLIPATLIGSSPDEFVFLGRYYSPYWYILSSCLLAAGTFLIWFRIFYELAGEKGRSLMSLGMLCLAVAAAVDYMFFGTHYGNMSSLLQYDAIPMIGTADTLKNLAAIAAAAAAFLWLRKKKPALARAALLAAAAAAVGMSALSMARVPAGLQNENLTLASSTREEDWPHITLSREGKNVVVLMMDRSLSCYLPYILTERPQLQEQFAGFTYYPNTLSYGNNTREGVPALFGGYEYTPEESNRRSDRSLVEKHNEALRVLPTLFRQQDYQVTVLNPSFAGYRWYPDLSIYGDDPGIHAMNTYGAIDGSQLEDSLREEYGEDFFGWQERNENALLRNFFCHGLFRAAPLFLQPTLYNQGYYNAAEGLAEADSSNGYAQIPLSISEAKGRSPEFVNCYDVLPLLGKLTVLDPDASGALVLMSNETTHSPCLLQTPDYRPALQVDNRDYDEAHALRPGLPGWEPLRLETQRQMEHYHVNMASLIQLGRWMDWLREAGVYDNTRIIIVGDHGTYLELGEETRIGDNWWEELTQFNPLLLVKDFGDTAFKVDRRFMTNADVPLLAMEGLVEHPVNPFTGQAMTDAVKHRPVHRVLFSENWKEDVAEHKTFPEGYWYSLSGDQVLNRDAWAFDKYE